MDRAEPGTRLRLRRSESAAGSRRRNRELASSLGAFPAFAGCRPDDLLALVEAGRVTSLPARWTFLHEGTPADACYVLLDGEVDVLRGGAVRASLGAGSVLGEMGLLGRSLRRASVVTTTSVTALHVDYDALTALLRSHPRLGSCLGAVYGQRVDADLRAPQGAVLSRR